MTTMTPMPQSMIISIIIIGVAYTLFTVFLQRKLADPKRSREIQYKMKVLSKELNTLIKSNAPKEVISKKQSEIMPLMGENMKKQFKPMLITLPLFFLIYYVLLKKLYSKFAKDTINFIVPLHYRGLFFVIVLILGSVLSVIILIYDRIKAKEEHKNQSPLPSNQKDNPQEINK